MRGMWVLAVVSTCVVAGSAGLVSAMAVARLSPVHPPALGRPVQGRAVDHVSPRWIGGLAPLGASPPRAALGLEQVPAQAPTPVPRTSTATRHVRSPERAMADPDQLHPATDRIMVLLVGWVLLASLGGGLLAPRR